MNLETKITIYKFTPQLFTLTRKLCRCNKKKTVPLQYQTKSGKIWKHFQANDKVGFSSIC